MASDKKIKIKSWYSNRYQIVVVQRNVLLLITVFSIIAVTISVFFVKNFMSSKSLEPYVIEIDDKTGMATVVEQLSSQNYTGNEMMRRYFINKYVQASMGYNPRNYKQNFEEVRLFSSAQIFNAYKYRINPSALGAESLIEVRIKSLLFKDNANVEIRTVRDFNISGQSPTTKNEVIFMTFSFSPEMNLTIEERLINPLGFQVSKFEIGEEIYSY